MAVWYYSQNGQAVGPVEDLQIHALVGQGKIKRDDLVWREGMPEWVEALQAGLFQDLKPPPTAPVSNEAAPASAAPQAASQAQTRLVQMPPFGRMIEECRKSIGPVPRRLVSSPYLSLVPPVWLQNNRAEPMWEIYRQQGLLYAEGIVVWGCVVKANKEALKPGKDDVPASIIYSPHPFFDVRVDELGRIAQVLGEMKVGPQTDPETANFVRAMFDDKNRGMRIAVPKPVFSEYPIFHTSVMVVRKHLPRGFISNGMVPILIKPQATPAAIVLPSCYWGQLVLNAWERAFQGILAQVAAARRAAGGPGGSGGNVMRK